METSLTGDWLQNLGLCSTLRAFEQEGIFIVPYLLWHGTSVLPVSSEEPPHLVASYDTQGGVEDVLYFKTSCPAEKPPFLGEPSDVVYSFVLGIKWTIRLSSFWICMMPPWQPWAFCAIQDGVQYGRQLK
jgi:hypothetical protein